MTFCSACECNEKGSKNSTCNGYGQCTCKKNIQGAKCNTCNAGLVDFPECKVRDEEQNDQPAGSNGQDQNGQNGQDQNGQSGQNDPLGPRIGASSTITVTIHVLAIFLALLLFNGS